MQRQSHREEPDKAGLVVISLNKDVLAKVFKHLNEKQLGRLMRVYERQTVDGVANEQRLLEAGKDFLAAGAAGPSEHFKEALVIALGEDGASQVMRRDRWRTIATKIQPAVLAQLLKDERPEVIGIVLAKLPASYAAALLGQLPDEVRASSIERVACNQEVSQRAADSLGAAIEQTLAGASEHDGQAAGVKLAAAMLNQLEAEVAAAIIEQIRRTQPARAAAIEQQMFHFEDLLKLDSRVLERILSSVQSDKLSVALKGLPAEQCNIMLAALTDQVKAIVSEELEESGKVAASDVRAARRSISELALQMEREGKIQLGREDPELPKA